ncbi:hypothetical protein PCC7418_0911 [Halothece sp. PCC 7418]|uniref:hypothetical protein n=1 Tax=Halothece sp. (strain PCC 7418) TaxID=65093 RepID=UPI0002A067B4|nr:hypothetical protein [Halothece sp. PCC 7418]AFZ43122.1 hypothetical protein PCC7418_0911 [Halothece sp. PCC 7418]
MKLLDNQDHKVIAPNQIFQDTLTTNAANTIKIDVDYSLDSNNFFDTPLKREALEDTLNSIVARLGDDLDPITPTGNNTWEMTFPDPSTGNLVNLANATIPADTLRIFVGGQQLGNRLGEGGFGGFSATGTPEFVNTVSTRGETGDTGESNTATDFSTWGGAISFDNDTNWYFGEDVANLGNDQSDFRSVVAHEFFHLLGFATGNQSFEHLIDNTTFSFTGTEAVREYDQSGNPPLNGSADLAHWEEGLTEDGQETLMDPSITIGTRQMPTALDFAALDDIGWELIDDDNDSSPSEKFFLLQPTSPDLIGGGSNNDTYIISDPIINGTEEITISDTQGSNSIQLTEGLEIESSLVAPNALQLNLTNGAVINVNSADDFSYEPGGNAVAGINEPDDDFSTFVQETLGVNLPSGDEILEGGSVTII